jgi:hypothetical protein
MVLFFQSWGSTCSRAPCAAGQEADAAALRVGGCCGGGDPDCGLPRRRPSGGGPRRRHGAAVGPGQRRVHRHAVGPPQGGVGAALLARRRAAGLRLQGHRCGGVGCGRGGGPVPPEGPPRAGDGRGVCGAGGAPPGQRQQGRAGQGVGPGHPALLPDGGGAQVRRNPSACLAERSLLGAQAGTPGCAAPPSPHSTQGIAPLPPT